MIRICKLVMHQFQKLNRLVWRRRTEHFIWSLAQRIRRGSSSGEDSGRMFREPNSETGLNAGFLFLNQSGREEDGYQN